MLTICPRGYPPNTHTCPGCKYREQCALWRQPDEAIVINGLFGVWRLDGKLIVENTSGKLILSAGHLDSLISVLQVAQQELAQSWEQDRPCAACGKLLSEHPRVHVLGSCPA